METYRAGGPLKWKDAKAPIKDEHGHYKVNCTEQWITIRTACENKVLVSSMSEFDELVPDARPDDRYRVQELFETYETDDHKLYLTIYPAD
jgi:hypothetical protein